MQCACDISYCHLWPVRVYHISPHYLIKGMIFEKKNSEHKMSILIFSTTYAINIFHCQRIKRGTVINVHNCSCKLEFSRQIFPISPQIKKFMKILTVKAEVYNKVTGIRQHNKHKQT